MYRPSPPSQWPRRRRHRYLRYRYLIHRYLRHRYRRIDYTNSLPDECLALIFNHLTTTKDRNNSSLVSQRWLRVEAETRTHLTLNARSELRQLIPSIFNRFNSLTQLVLCNSDRSLDSINDNDMCLITSKLPNLTRLELRQCLEITDSGVAAFSKNINKLKEFSCVDCVFSDLGIFELLRNCSQLEVLSVTRLYSLYDVRGPAKFRAGLPANTLKVIELRYVYSERLFEPLIAVGEHSMNLQELILIGVNATHVSLEVIARNCQNLVRLELSMSETITDVEMSCIAEKYVALKSLCIEECCVSNKGIEEFALGCPNLAKIRVTKCKKVTREVKDWLIERRSGQIKCT